MFIRPTPIQRKPNSIVTPKTPNSTFRDGNSTITQASIDSLCAPLKETIMKNRERASHASLLGSAATVLLAG